MSTCIELAGVTVELLAARAAYAPTLDMLLVADLHLGKDATFRARGMAVPSGPSADTLNRLSALVSATNSRRLVLLGDLFHGPESNSEEELDAFRQFQERHAGLDLHLILGNHDRWMRPANLPGIVHSRWSAEGIALVHDPDDADGPAMAGHLHPGVTLPGPARTSHRFCCFWLRGECLILPAFGSFTDSCRVDVGLDDRVFACIGSRIIEVSALSGRA